MFYTVPEFFRCHLQSNERICTCKDKTIITNDICNQGECLTDECGLQIGKARARSTVILMQAEQDS